MTSLIAPTRPLRRLLSAVLTIGVLLATLGWGHPACDRSAERQDAGSPLVVHVGMDVAHDAEPVGSETTRHAPERCPEHDRHEEPGTGGCAPVAHCVVAVVATASIVPAAQV